MSAPEAPETLRPAEPFSGVTGESQRIAESITDISENVLTLVHEEIELAKAEVEEKVSRLIRGLVVGFAAGLFVIGALFIALDGFSWLAWWGLPVGTTEFFWGFFLVAGVLILLAALAGGLAARALRMGSPPVPSMALEEAKRIRETVGAGAPGADSSSVGAGLPGWDPVASAPAGAELGAARRGEGPEGA